VLIGLASLLMEEYAMVAPQRRPYSVASQLNKKAWIAIVPGLPPYGKRRILA